MSEFVPGLVAIIGRPNVGKSTLFNRLARERVSIVEDTPGVTRDRIFRHLEWRDKPYILCDTGGLEPSSGDPILQAMRRQTQLAIEEADVVLFMVDGREGLNPADHEVANLLRRADRPVVLAVNKTEARTAKEQAWEFTQLGFESTHFISSAHGQGIDDIMTALLEHLPDPPPEEQEASVEAEDEEAAWLSEFPSDFEAMEDEEQAEVYEAIDSARAKRFSKSYPLPDVIKLAVIGKPNAGKSTLVNHLLGEDRFLVSDMAGTTRDAVDATFEREGQRYAVIDTAGIRRKRSISSQLERYSVVSALRALDRSDIALHLIDITQGVSEQDAKIAAFAHEKGKAVILVLNKWDAQPKGQRDRKAFLEELHDKLKFMRYAPVFFTSALTGQGLDKLLTEVSALLERYYQRIPTSKLNDCLQEANRRHQAPSFRGNPIRLLFGSQVRVAPPSIVIHTSHPEGVDISYRRYVINRLRERFDFAGVPITVWYRKRDSHGGRNQGSKRRRGRR